MGISRVLTANARPDSSGLGGQFVYWGGDALPGIILPVHSKIARGNRTLSPRGISVAPETYVYDANYF